MADRDFSGALVSQSATTSGLVGPKRFTGGLVTSAATVAGTGSSIVRATGALVAANAGFSCQFVPFFIHMSGALRTLDVVINGTMSKIPIRPRPQFEVTPQRKGYKKHFTVRVRDI